MRTGFIQQRTVRNDGLSGKFVSDCLVNKFFEVEDTGHFLSLVLFAE